MDPNAELITINGQFAIPRTELKFQTARSGGPGGQHVNTADTKVMLRYDIQQSTAFAAAFSEAEQARILNKLAHRVDANGILQIVSQETRSQHKNRELAVVKLRETLLEALHKPKPRKKTRPSRKAKERRLAQKKHRSKIKKDRQKKWPE